MARLQNRVAIITGGAQGIGAAYARGFAAEGANVVIADVAPADAVIDEIKSAGGTVIATRTDVTDEAACADMAARNTSLAAAEEALEAARASGEDVEELEAAVEEARAKLEKEAAEAEEAAAAAAKAEEIEARTAEVGDVTDSVVQLS